MNEFKTFVEENEIEFREDNGSVLIWVPFDQIEEFYNIIKSELNPYYHDESFEYVPNGELQENCICFDLTLILDHVELDLLMVFMRMESEG